MYYIHSCQHAYPHVAAPRLTPASPIVCSKRSREDSTINAILISTKQISPTAIRLGTRTRARLLGLDGSIMKGVVTTATTDTELFTVMCTSQNTRDSAFIHLLNVLESSRMKRECTSIGPLKLSASFVSSCCLPLSFHQLLMLLLAATGDDHKSTTTCRITYQTKTFKYIVLQLIYMHNIHTYTYILNIRTHTYITYIHITYITYTTSTSSNVQSSISTITSHASPRLSVE